MADNTFGGVVDSLMKGMDSFLSCKTVVGEATTIGDTIIVPLVDVTFGVGAGTSTADRKTGGVGGMSAKMTPSAVLVIKNGQTKLVNIKNQDTVTKILDMVPELVERIVPKKDTAMTDAQAVDLAFPEQTEPKL